ncbi:MAG: leucine-rich repeat domain-containing protein [Christensenellales bacterium]
MNSVSKKLVRLAVFMAAIVIFALAFSSCGFLGGNSDIVAPKLDPESPPKIQRINPDYYNQITRKDEIYFDPEATMPVKPSERVYLVINYVNKSNLPINRVVFSGGGETFDIMRKDFRTESNSNQTIIEFQIPEDAKAKTQLTYTISQIYYQAGSRIIPMKVNADLANISVIVTPEFTIKFDHQNADQRTGKDGTTSTTKVNYYQELKDVIPEQGQLNAPTKEGGWAFRGYYTLPGGPDGSGIRVRASDNYYFWDDITLYAYYERLYEFQIVDLKEEEYIPYEVDGEIHYYTKAAIAGKKTAAGDVQQHLEIYDTIADNDGVYPIIAVANAAFGNTAAMRTLTIGKYVKTIGKNAFDGCNVEVVNFHEDGVLEKIDDGAFRNTTELGDNFSLPTTVKYLGDRAFQNSGWGGTLTIEPHLTYIGDYCFAMTPFTTVNFSAGVLFDPEAEKGEEYYLGTNLFSRCQNLKTFRTYSDNPEQPNGLKVIPDFMFDVSYYENDSKVGLTSVTLAEGLIRIGKGAFCYQKLLTSIQFPVSLEDLGGNAYVDAFRNESGAFENCLSLRTMTFPQGSQLKVLGASAFKGNRELKEVRITSEILEKFGNGPFQNCDNFTELHFANKSIIPEPLVNYNELTLIKPKPADIFHADMDFKIFVNNQVLEGFQEVFNDTKGENVFSYDMIKQVQDYRIVFKEIVSQKSNQYGLNLVYIFDDHKEIDLTNLNLSGIDFSNLTNLQNKNIIAIGSNSFNKDVEEVKLPSTIEMILDQAFKNCTKLHTVLHPINHNLQSIGKEAFYNTGITSFKGGENLSIIGENAFMLCKSLVWVDLGPCLSTSTLFAIGTGAFQSCSSLRYVRFPTKYMIMNDSMFAKCTSLNYLVFMNENPENEFFGNVSARFQDIPDGITTAYVMTQQALENYNNLDRVPRHLQGRFVLWNDFEEPTPEKLLHL